MVKLVGVIAPAIIVIAGVVVAFATVPENPLAVATDTEVTEPPPDDEMADCTIAVVAILVELSELAWVVVVGDPASDTLVFMVVALPDEVTSPVRFALVTTVAALPTEVTPPVKLAFVVTVPAVKPDAVPVRFVATPEAGVPRMGATNVC